MGSVTTFKGNRSIKKALCLVLILFLFTACENKRPPGFLTVGKVADLSNKSQFVVDKQIYIRKDDKGLSLMSTLCSYDLSQLRLVDEGGKQVFVSDYTESKYDIDGNVLHGPATKNLSYYAGRIDSGEYGSAKDTIYADFAHEVDRNWRLPITQH